MAKMSVNCVLVVISLLVSWFSTSLYVEGKRQRGREGEREREGEKERESAFHHEEYKKGQITYTV